MTIYELCMSKAYTFECLRNDELRNGNEGNGKRWAERMNNAIEYAKSLPIEIASFDIGLNCPFKD